ncbi:hypothetical protein [Micromonospora sagamiensis]|uniref:Uncharacterized protein n=1 Tax=Micromonospora sagamiensis TaxID=47875 RepID=A0A562WPM3_9ACTN|nr:hypothetical protein [Micromonospora sagamiensis]TWJ32249.1 hypothetical protein JD81_05824 [Micromonospora sagamiensis]BCL14691.1 hypothetical protein GCM10017556_24300 [Micromonospora sagamiensis]
MLSQHQRDAIVHCLHGIDAHAAAMHNCPGPVLFAWLRETPIESHPGPTARAVTVVPLLVEPARWQNEPDGPVAALRQITEEAHHPSHQATIALQAGHPYKVNALAYLFMYPTIVEQSNGPVETRYIEAVDSDGTVYVLTRLPDTDHGVVVTVDEPDDSETIALLRRLVTLTYPSGANP